MLGVEVYDTAEAAAVDRLCNRITQAFYPEMFATLGYPTRVKNAGQLWRFIDVMHETRTRFNVEHLLYGLTAEEFDLFKRVTRIVDEHAQRQFNRRAHASAALLRALHVLRLIKIVTGDERPTVLEVGPGCGYLGMLLLMEGYPYVATDVVQALYLYQSHMLSYVATKLHELAEEDGDILTIEQPSPGTAIHVPWWKWATLTPEKVKLSAGVMTSNHVLCEMHPNSMAYLAVVARRILSNDPKGGTFVFENWGYNLLHSEFSVLDKFMINGFRLCHNERLMSAMALADRIGGWETYDPHAAPAKEPTAGPAENVTGANILLRKVLNRVPALGGRLTTILDDLERSKQRSTAARADIAGPCSATSAPTERSRVPEFKPGNPLSLRLTDGLTAIIRQANVTEADIQGFLSVHFGSDVPRHADEDFFGLIGLEQ